MQFHAYLTALAQNAVPRSFSFFNVPNLQNVQRTQPRSQGLIPGLGAGREKTLASAGHVSTLHSETLGVIY